MNEPAVLPHAPTLEDIERIEGALLMAEGQGHAVPLETWHQFAEGLVARTIFIPAGTCLAGAEHRSEHLNVCHGDITVWAADTQPLRLTGHHVISALPGVKRQGVAHADTWWTTVHLNPGNERDIAALEDALVVDAERLQSRRLSLVDYRNPEAIAP